MYYILAFISLFLLWALFIINCLVKTKQLFRWNCFRFIFEKERFNSIEISILDDPGYNNDFNVAFIYAKPYFTWDCFVTLLYFPSSCRFYEENNTV